MANLVSDYQAIKAFVEALTTEFPEALAKKAEIEAFAAANPKLLRSAMKGDADAMATVADGFIKREGVAAVSANGERLTGVFLENVLTKANKKLLDQAAEDYEGLLTSKGYKSKGQPDYDPAKDIDREMVDYRKRNGLPERQEVSPQPQSGFAQAGTFVQTAMSGLFRTFTGAPGDAMTALGRGEYASDAARVAAAGRTGLRVIGGVLATYWVDRVEFQRDAGANVDQAKAQATQEQQKAHAMKLPAAKIDF